MLESVGYIQKLNKDGITVLVPEVNTYSIERQNITECTVRFEDGRTISPEQRKKIYATIADIADYTGDVPDFMKEWLKYCYIERCGGEYFSLSNCSITTARDFISFLIDFCFEQNIGTRDTLLNRTDDISRYLYSCLANRRCVVCNGKGEIHHCEGSRVGMGFDRNKIDNIGRNAICLCRKHHNQAHNDERRFFDKYHIYGIKLDEYLVKKLKL